MEFVALDEPKVADLYERRFVLVRPDGYIGAIVSSEHVDALRSYLSDVGLHTEGLVS